MPGDLVAREVAAREEHPEAREHAGYDTHPQEDAAVLLEPASEHSECPQAGHYEGPAHHGPAHVVRVLREGPRVEQDRPVVVELYVAVRKRLEARENMALSLLGRF